MNLQVVRKTFKLDDKIILDCGTVIHINKRGRNSIKGHYHSGFHLVIEREGEIGKITVVRPHENKTEEEVNGNTWEQDSVRH